MASVQSGVFLDYYVAGTHGNAHEDLGPRIMGGRLDPATGRGVLDGNCAPGTELAGEPATFDVVVGADGLVSGMLTIATESTRGRDCAH